MIAILAPLMWLIERPFAFVQRHLGFRGLAWMFLFPNLLLFGVFVFLPIFLNVFYATTSGDELMLAKRPGVGLDNFSSLLNCENHFDPNTCEKDIFWRSIWNTLWFVVLQVGLMVGFALMTALILNKEIRARGFFRGVFFFPVLLSPVVVALVWKWIVQRDGILNGLIEALGGTAFNWLLDPSWAFAWSVFISVWAHMGFYALILLAGLQAIPKDIYDAAVLDQAKAWRTFSRITLPLLAPNFLVVLVLALIKGVQTFDEVYAFTGGGPGTATTLIIQYIYETGFGGAPRLLGLAAAASIMLALVLVVLTGVQLWINRRNVDG